MKYIKLGNSDLNVSRICLGCMGFGDVEKGMHKWTLDEKKSAEIIKVALDYGINFFDTAVAYQNGTSEKYLGSAIRKFAKREDVVIATKFLPRTQDDINKGISGREHIIQSLDTSLSNLGMDFIDLYIYHMWDYNTPIEEVMETLNDVITDGKVRYIGISNCYAWQLQKANMIAQMNGWNKFVSVQSHYNLIFRETEREMTGCCIDGNIAMTPYSALASGRLVKDSSETSERLEKDSFAKGKYDKTADVDRIIIERVAEIANKRKMTRIQIALGWLLTKVTSPIIGATKISHVEEAVKAISVQLSDEEIAYLEEPYVPHKLVGVMAK
ncbi:MULTISPECIES: aldo/keto reductase [Clostridium]|uniref:aldo/keto reductase n=1 Tax=Clostridium TaxID=1485 RepID=UPI0005C17042|nr:MULTISPECIES: aldo/keto reductase [Clostridium]AXB87164.1 aldo/keto reductase [Clostridium butyricum]KIU05055.1 aryl-alcohol dehydrogenase W [Clostridium butyricum]KJZ84011.1 L-fuco-beta-pyranose dehydrogenase [Clostridium sp. IBUN125C]MBA8969047.1 aryl-alcohol dehydrogenase-like predicted oxidoreductase [Clostridium butyricum]MBA8973095.1 aryl-alcohol dehydrogenase-like predicted oxidoreductase [Clostridium butyricum]